MRPTNSEPGALFSPSRDVVENDKALDITTNLPGVSEKDIGVTIVNNMLTIQGELKAEKKEEKEKKDGYRMVDRSYGSFR